jgi:hypothetical protein
MTQRKNRRRRKKAIRPTGPTDHKAIWRAIERSSAPATALAMCRTL